MNIVWQDNAADESAYRVERLTSTEATYLEIAEVAADTTTYQDNSVSPGRQYYYRIRATSGSGVSDYTIPASGVTPP